MIEREAAVDMTPEEKLQELISGSDNIVFFGGAGVSTESGIPDFRSVMACIIRNTTIRRRKF